MISLCLLREAYSRSYAGFMMCSEALVIRKDPADSLPLVLADNGYVCARFVLYALTHFETAFFF